MLKIRTLKTIIPQTLKPGQELKDSTPIVPSFIPSVPNVIPLPHIPVMAPARVSANTSPRSSVGTAIPPRPPVIHSVSHAVQTPEVLMSVASVQTQTPVAEAKGVQVDARPPQVFQIPGSMSPPAQIIRISSLPASPNTAEPTIIVLPSVPTTDPVAKSATFQRPAAVPVPIPVRMSPPEMIQTPNATGIVTPTLFSGFPNVTHTAGTRPQPVSAAFVEDVNVVDGTTFPPGAEFIKSWRMINDGNVDWPADTVLTFVGGARLAAFKDAPLHYDVGRVKSGDTVDVWAGDLKAPEDEGLFSSFWRLRKGIDGDFFGHRVCLSA